MDLHRQNVDQETFSIFQLTRYIQILILKKSRGCYLAKECVPEGKNPATAERKVFSIVFEGKLFKNAFAGNSL